MATRQQQPNDGPLLVDQKGVAHYNGDPACGDEFQERAILGYYASEEKLQKLYAIKLNNFLNGRAWNLARKRAEIATPAVLDKAGENPIAAVKLAVATARQARERIAALQKQRASEEH
eukprot:9499309-Pyramimonas_sp.AAC.1